MRRKVFQKVVQPSGACVAVLLAAMGLSGCAATEGSGSSEKVELASTHGDLQVDLLARRGSGEGEICVAVTIATRGEIDGASEECGAVSSPMPMIGGYSVGEMHEENFAYSWGVFRNDVAEVKASSGVVVDTERISSIGDQDCCVVYLATVMGDADERAAADLVLYGADGSELSVHSLRSVRGE